MRERWRIFRERWPYLPFTWKAAIIGLGGISVLEIIRTIILPLVRWAFF